MKGEPMAQSVAFAKTTRPAIGSIVPRARLFARLDGAPGRTVAWISGPPGAGKTSLAASYVEARNWRVLWYQVDADDADVATFFHYLGHAARKLEGERPQELPKFAPQYGADVALFARKFFRELFARAKGSMALVLDSLQAVPADSALHTVLEAAFTQVPKNCCVVITSRNEPPPSLARLRVTGEMTVVSGDGLRFEQVELGEIARLRGHELPAAAAAQLASRTQGWAAGIVLMLEHAKLSGRLAEFPDDAAPRAIFDYLAGEIFARFERETQQFLLRIACLPRMSAAVAEGVSGEPKAGRLLLNLALNDYFVSEVAAEEGRVFQLHPLLRDFLRNRAAQDLPEALAPAHLRRAASLLAGSGQVEDAVSLLAECRDWPEIARLAAGAAEAMLAQGRSGTLAGWLELLPAEVLGADARLLKALAACRGESSPRAARRLYEQAFEAFRGSGDPSGMMECCAGLIDATLLEFDDLAALDHWIPVLAGLLAERRAAGREAGAALAALLRALLLRDPGAELEVWMERAAAAMRAADQPPELKAALSLARSTAALLRGDIASAGAILEELAARIKEYASPLPVAIGLASALHQLLVGSYESAGVRAREALAAAAADAMHDYDAWLSAINAAALLGAGERDAARSELQALEANGAALRRGDRAAVHYLRAWLGALEGNGALAQREARTAVAMAAESGMPWIECLARVALAETLAEANDWRACEAQLRSAEALAARLRSALLQYAVHLAAAAAAHERRDEAGALASLRTAFALGREQGFQHVPSWRPAAVGDLCVLALRSGVEPEFARTLARGHALVPRTLPFRVKDWPWPFRIQTLGRFDLQRPGGQVEASGKGPGRPLELLKVLIALGGQSLRAEQLADALWPHAEADYAHKSFTATLHRLRRLLGMEEALLLRDARLTMNRSLLWVDTWALEQILSELDETLRAPAPASLGVAAKLMDEVFALYRGPFLPDESEQPAYIAYREQLRARLLRCLVRVARVWEEAGRVDAAVDGYLRCVEADPLFEAPYRNLMLCYQRAGDAAEARATYERLRAILSTRMKTLPSQETQAVFAGLAAPGGR
ncbi:MAG TPA: BTAD domain-containing putative transcriptional regulator [Burkholderiales bacterium]|nr:BTAD domain-containing putative transcriptional regulator [Burkholderiales bacterium]